MTDKKTISLIEDIAKKLQGVEVEQAKHGIQINAVMWIMGAILLTILPAFGFLIAFWVQNNNQ